jgi:hypothetical protein
MNRWRGLRWLVIERLQGTKKTFDAGGYAITFTAYVGGSQAADFE